MSYEGMTSEVVKNCIINFDAITIIDAQLEIVENILKSIFELN